MNDLDPRRGLPAVEVVAREAVRLVSGAPAALLTELSRAELAHRRASGIGGEGAAEAVVERLLALRVGELRRVINATGVLLQTNLGRAPLATAALARVADVARGYSTLEYDLVTGRRGERSRALSALFEALIGAPAVVVNNNAASLLLLLGCLSRGKEVVVSRGELIEIGGSFRLPEVMRLSGARLVEVGTTNRTRLEDYEAAVGPRTAILLKVHTSNYRVVGFTESVSLATLVTLGARLGLPVVEDLGSGALLPATSAEEPTVQDSLKAGASLVAFSGDKLLGGPQAGIIAGEPDLVNRLRRHPLYRPLRPDKLSLAALEGTLQIYLEGRGAEVPVRRMLAMTASQTRDRAQGWRAAIGVGEVVEVASAPGGGSMPGVEVAGFGLALGSPGARPSAALLARRLRAGTPPVVARIHEARVVLDPRTVDPLEDAELVAAVRAAIGG
ncbi:MAG: L-seryl-tRNA(Sec) selenium transferase [Candidatus Dormibacteria bacterium]